MAINKSIHWYESVFIYLPAPFLLGTQSARLNDVRAIRPHSLKSRKTFRQSLRPPGSYSDLRSLAYYFTHTHTNGKLDDEYHTPRMLSSSAEYAYTFWWCCWRMCDGKHIVLSVKSKILLCIHLQLVWIKQTEKATAKKTFRRVFFMPVGHHNIHSIFISLPFSRPMLYVLDVIFRCRWWKHSSLALHFAFVFVRSLLLFCTSSEIVGWCVSVFWFGFFFMPVVCG